MKIWYLYLIQSTSRVNALHTTASQRVGDVSYLYMGKSDFNLMTTQLTFVLKPANWGQLFNTKNVHTNQKQTKKIMSYTFLKVTDLAKNYV